MVSDTLSLIVEPYFLLPRVSPHRYRGFSVTIITTSTLRVKVGGERFEWGSRGKGGLGVGTKYCFLFPSYSHRPKETASVQHLGCGL